ncbi:MAG: hypothetical protein WBJ42_06720 [Thermovirgaceae bacterium]|nr:hypothetical protein [Synergistales bacterium]HPC76042.1 hypothetical protein [Synergistales bacterium]HRS48819.1 hypothetical protein [Thermovirgaceae bacterium]HRU90863.1 hypothetical protein [Thermovirgaceae bacterium]
MALKKALVFFTLLTLLAASPAFSFNEPEGYDSYRWGQPFSEFQDLSDHEECDEEEGQLTWARADSVARTWKGLKFVESPLFFFNQLRFEGFLAEGCPGRAEWETWCEVLERELGTPSRGSAELDYVRWESPNNWVQIVHDPDDESNLVSAGAYLEGLDGEESCPPAPEDPFEDGFKGLRWGAKSYGTVNIKFVSRDHDLNISYYLGQGDLKVSELGGIPMKKGAFLYGFKNSTFSMLRGTALPKDREAFEGLKAFFESFLGPADTYSPNKSSLWERERYKVFLYREKDGSVAFWLVNKDYHR